MKTPETFSGNPLSKQLRNTLLSVLFCGGLLVAYYQLADQTPIPPDTHITYAQTDRFRLDIDATGQVSLSDNTGAYHYQISQLALRRILRAFHRAKWFDRNILAYGGIRSKCLLSLTESHRKLALRHDCETQASKTESPVQSLESATQFRKVLQGHKQAIRDYRVTRSEAFSLPK